MQYEQLVDEKGKTLKKIAKGLGVPVKGEVKKKKEKEKLALEILKKQSALVRERREEGPTLVSTDTIIPLLPVRASVDSMTKFAAYSAQLRAELNELSPDVLLETASRLGYSVERTGSYAVVQGYSVPTTEALVSLMFLLQMGIV